MLEGSQMSSLRSVLVCIDGGKINRPGFKLQIRETLMEE